MESANEFGLTKQEVYEADKLIELYFSGEALRLRNVGLARSAEEIILNCYATTKEKVSCVVGELQIVQKIAKKLALEHEEHSKIMSQLKNISKKNKYPIIAGALIGIAICDIPFRNNEICSDAMHFFELNVSRLQNAEDIWHGSQKNLRKLFDDIENSNSFVKPLRDTLVIWASASENRRQYLLSKGVHIAGPKNLQNCSLSNKAQKPVHTRRKKTPVDNAPATKAEQLPEKLWQVSFINPASGNVAEIVDVLFEKDKDIDGLKSMLAKRLSRALSVDAALRQIKTLLGTHPSNRLTVTESARVFDKNWHKLRVGKYRVLVLIKDAESKIFLMAGHWKKLYGALKIGHSEA